MSSPDEMRSQPAKQSAADAADDDIVVIDEEAAIKGPGRGPEAAGDTASAPARASRTAPPAPRDDRRWREIQAMFVDDPRDSVQRASDLIDAAVEKLLASIRQRQAALASSWQNRNADTEALRTTLQSYRALWAVVRDMPAADMSGGPAAASAGVGGRSFGAGPGGAAGPREPERGGRSFGAGPAGAAGPREPERGGTSP